MAKVNLPRRSDQLALGLFIASILFALSSFWQSSEILNSFSSALTMIGVALLWPFFVFLAAFWILMLVDSLKSRKFLWAILIILFTTVAAVIYFLVEKPKIIANNIRFFMWAGLGLYLVGLLFLVPNMAWYSDNSATTRDARVSFTGKIVSINTKPLASDGDGVYKVKDAAGNVETVLLSSGESRCDSQAIKVPAIKVGDKVIVEAVSSEADNNSLRVCKAGTYIREL